MIKDILGVPQEPSELPNIHIGYDWLGQDIYSDDGDDYIEHEGDLILDEPEHIRAYLLENAVIKNTMQLYEEARDGEFIRTDSRI